MTESAAVNTENTPQQHHFRMPHTYVIIFAMVAICAVLTWIIPAGVFDRTTSAAGYTTVVPGSYHQVESTPVGIVGIFYSIEQGFVQAADIIFFIIFAYGFVSMMIKNGSFDALMGALIRKTGRLSANWIFAIIMIVFGILGSTMGMSEETYGMYPIFIGIAQALGYDAIVGVSIVSIGVQTGFASATLNPFTVGVANAVSGISMTREMLWFRLFCFVLFEGVGIFYVLRYASMIKKDPTKSLLYGTRFQHMGEGKSRDELTSIRMTGRNVACGITFVVVFALMVWGVIVKGWYIDELAVLFMISMVVVGIIGGFNANQIAETFVDGAREMIFGAMIVGLARGILITLQSGQIIDTILYGLSSWLGGAGKYASGIIMVVIQNIMNFFIPSGSGQAAAVMPIMAPLSDLLGVSRQVAVLAETFGDGYSNMFIPTGVFTICGISGVPVDKWYPYIAKLFAVYFVLQLVMISVAIGIGL